MFDDGLPMPFANEPAKAIAGSSADFDLARPGLFVLFLTEQAVAVVCAEAELEAHPLCHV